MSAIESIFVLLLATSSSLLLWIWGRRRLGLSGPGLGRALASLLECLGWAVLIYAVNLVAGLAVTALVRTASGRFVSLYPVADPVLFILSLLQALVFCWWWQERRG